MDWWFGRSHKLARDDGLVEHPWLLWACAAVGLSAVYFAVLPWEQCHKSVRKQVMLVGAAVLLCGCVFLHMCACACVCVCVCNRECCVSVFGVAEC